MGNRETNRLSQEYRSAKAKPVPATPVIVAPRIAVTSRKKSTRTITNAEYATSNQTFQIACGLAGIPATGRQAAKYQRGSGSAYQALRHFKAVTVLAELPRLIRERGADEVLFREVKENISNGVDQFDALMLRPREELEERHLKFMERHRGFTKYASQLQSQIDTATIRILQIERTMDELRAAGS